MKTFLLFVSILLAGTAMGQKTKSNKAKIDFLQYPSVPVEGVEEIGIRVYTGDLPFNKDTLRLYLGNVDMMKSNVERFSKVKFEALNDIRIAGGQGDLTVDMAIGEPVVISKEQKQAQCMIPKDGCTQYYYTVTYRMPALVEVSNASGTLDTWELEPEMTLQFGNEQIEKHQNTEEGSQTSIRVVNYTSEVDLNMAFAAHGAASLARKGIVIQMGKMAESIYDNLFFDQGTLTFDIAYGSGKATDYSETEKAASDAVAALEGKDYAALSGPIKTWEAWLERYDPNDKKAAVNQKVAQGLYENLSIAYTFTGNFEDARTNLEKALELAQTGFVNENEVARLKKFRGFIDRQEKVKQHNSALKTGKLVTAPDVKSTLARRKFNKDLNFLYAEDRYAAIAKKHGASAPKKDISEMSVEEYLAQALTQGDAADADSGEEASIEGRVANNALILSGIVDGHMRGKAFPAAICEHPEVKTIRAVNIGFTSLPDCLDQLVALEVLALGSNSFESVPDVFGSMPNLKNLDLSNNKLTSLPESIYGLKGLKKLSVSGNQIPDDQMARLAAALPDCKIK